MKVKRLFHVNICCSDMERSLAFYTDVLGAKVVLDATSSTDDFLADMGYPGGSAHRAVVLYSGDQDRGPFIDLLEYEEKGDRTPHGTSGFRALRSP